jgi:hypothetical protein
LIVDLPIFSEKNLKYVFKKTGPAETCQMEGPLQGCAAQVHLNAIPFLASNPVDFHRFPQKSTKITTWTGYRIWIHLEAAKLNPWRIQADFFFGLLIMQQSAVHVADFIQIEFCQYQPN